MAEATKPKNEPSLAEALRRAEGVCKDAEHRHSQQVSHVLRLRKQLSVAEEKETAAARAVAEATMARKAAAQAVAHAEG
eukprot:3432599-Pyramimonas_sp.AAC.1